MKIKKLFFVGLFHDLFALPMIAFIPLMKWQVFVNSEPNLTEMMAVNGDQQIFKNYLLPNITLAEMLEQFLDSHQIQSVEKITIANGWVQKILKQELGSRPVFISTLGFENWPDMNLPILHPQANLKAQRVRSALKHDYVFGVNEKTNSAGEIQRAVDADEVSHIIAKIQLLDKKNVAIGVLNSHLNGQNEAELKNQVIQAGLRAFCCESHYADLPIENHRWWNAILNAFIYPFMEEVLMGLDRLAEKLQCHQIKIGQSHDEYKNWNEEQYLGSALFHHRLLQNLANESQNVLLYFGLEEILLANVDSTSHNVWNSPKGPVYNEHPNLHTFPIAPNQVIFPNQWETLGFGYDVVDYKPGPMCMGRGQKLCFLDVVFYLNQFHDSKLLKDRADEKTLSRIEEYLFAIGKVSQDPNPPSPGEMARMLLDGFLKTLSLPIVEAKKVLICGPLADLFFPLLKKHTSFAEIVKMEWDSIVIEQMKKDVNRANSI